VATATPATSWPRCSQAQLDAGRRFVFLFTDVANPTSNRIYQDVGYEPVIDFDRIDFVD
jgi:predicted GNAT family acetyltransferase